MYKSLKLVKETDEVAFANIVLYNCKVLPVQEAQLGPT